MTGFKELAGALHDLHGDDDECCRSCLYYIHRDGHRGSCHRLPPSHPPAVHSNRWPVVFTSEWCGEWDNGYDASEE